MNKAIRKLVRLLDELPDCSGLQALFSVVQESRIDLLDVAEYVRFDSERYHRELISQSEKFQLLVLGWLPGQKSPIHNHRGSQCCVRVLQGTAVETVYSQTSNGLFDFDTTNYPIGSMLCGEDADIHTVENLASSHDGLVTMHIYRPALTQMQLFHVNDGRLVVDTPVALRLS